MTEKTKPTVEKAMMGEFAHNENPDLIDEKASRFGDALHVVPLPQSLQNMSEDELKKMRRHATLKLDAVILTGVVIMYILNYLDRQNISAARLAGIQEDLNLSDVQYQTVVSILFVGYILFQVPSNLLASKTKHPALYINFMMCLWGILSACTAAAKGYGSLLAIRILIGITECAFFPGALYYVTTFYSRSQLAVRTAILYAGSQLGNAVGGLIAIGILKLDGQQGIAGWRWLFLIEGIVTIFIGLIFGLVMPSNPQTTKLLNETERDLILYYFELDEFGTDTEEDMGAWAAFYSCISDIKLWCVCGILSLTYIAGAVVQFFPSVVETLGYERTATYGLTAPPYILCVILMILNGFHSDTKRERYLHCLWPQFVIIIANVIPLATLNTGARYFAMMLMPSGNYASAIITLSWIGSTMNEPRRKRAVAFALCNTLGNTPNVWASYLYTGAPRYIPAFSVNVAAGFLAICLTTFTWWYLRRCNQRLDRGESVHGVTEKQQERGFRYML